MCVVLPPDCPAADAFLDGEPKKIRAKFAVLFQQMANFGTEGMQPKRFKKEMGDFFAFRHEINNLLYRFPCFRDGTAWVITHGFIKPGARNGKLGEWPPQQVARAESIRHSYLDRKKAKDGGKK